MQQSGSRFRWPVAVEQAIAAPAGAVWDAISMPGNLEPCHPYCAKNPVHRWPGPDSHDEIRYLSGLVYERHFSDWLDGVGYDLEIRRRGDPIAFVSWRIAAVDDRHCSLRITVHPYYLQNLPVAVRWLPHLFRMRPKLKAYLDSVTKGFAWYVTRGEAVPRNAFGRHPWFSGREAAAGAADR